MQNNRIRLLKVMEIIRRTDETNPVTTKQIVEELEKYDITAERKAVDRDINALIDCGWDILQCEDNKLGFYLASREFEDWELKILTDAVLGANFLTENNSKEIADKIGLLASETTAKALKAVTPVETDIKTGDISTKNNIDIIFRAIKDKKKLVFRYVFTGADLEKHFKFDDEQKKISPYALIWRQDKYYLIANYREDKKLSYYRLDRIREPKLLDEPAIPAVELLGPNPDMYIADYVKNNIYNTDGQKILLMLKADNNMVDTLIDSFGENVKIKSVDKDHVSAVVSVSESKGLYQWLLRYSENIQVTEPENVRKNVIEKLNSALNQYK